MTINELSHQEEIFISHYIANIYRQAQQMKTNDFRYFCLDSLNELINFDAALWFDRREKDIAFTNLETFTYQLPDNLIENYNKYISKEELAEDPVGKYALDHPNVAFTLADIYTDKQEFYQSDLYKLHCKKFNQTDVLTALTQSNVNQNIQAIALYKFNHDETFSVKDKIIKSILDPHFIEAMSMNILSNLDRFSDSADMCRAITDIHGNILEAENVFINKLQRHNNGNTTHIELPKLINDKAIAHKLTDGTTITVKLKDTLVLVELSKTIELTELLTPKQIKICALLKDGLPDKGMASALNISSHTISNHLKSIYKRLGTKNRVGTLAYLSAED